MVLKANFENKVLFLVKVKLAKRVHTFSQGNLN